MPNHITPYSDDVFVSRPAALAALGPDQPLGEFMIPLPLASEYVTRVPRRAGCYLVYLGHHPYYAGMSRVDIRRRLSAHVSGRGSRMIRQMMAEGHKLYFEYCSVEDGTLTTSADIELAELWFMLFHTADLLPGNLKADGIRAAVRAGAQKLLPTS
jgi:hypothetical protein